MSKAHLDLIEKLNEYKKNMLDRDDHNLYTEKIQPYEIAFLAGKVSANKLKADIEDENEVLENLKKRLKAAEGKITSAEVELRKALEL